MDVSFNKLNDMCDTLIANVKDFKLCRTNIPADIFGNPQMIPGVVANELMEGLNFITSLENSSEASSKFTLFRKRKESTESLQNIQCQILKNDDSLLSIGSESSFHINTKFTDLLSYDNSENNFSDESKSEVIASKAKNFADSYALILESDIVEEQKRDSLLLSDSISPGCSDAYTGISVDIASEEEKENEDLNTNPGVQDICKTTCGVQSGHDLLLNTNSKSATAKQVATCSKRNYSLLKPKEKIAWPAKKCKFFDKGRKKQKYNTSVDILDKCAVNSSSDSMDKQSAKVTESTLEMLYAAVEDAESSHEQSQDILLSAMAVISRDYVDNKLVEQSSCHIYQDESILPPGTSASENIILSNAEEGEDKVEETSHAGPQQPQTPVGVTNLTRPQNQSPSVELKIPTVYFPSPILSSEVVASSTRIQSQTFPTEIPNPVKSRSLEAISSTRSPKFEARSSKIVSVEESLQSQTLSSEFTSEVRCQPKPSHLLELNDCVRSPQSQILPTKRTSCAKSLQFQDLPSELPGPTRAPVLSLPSIICGKVKEIKSPSKDDVVHLQAMGMKIDDNECNTCTEVDSEGMIHEGINEDCSSTLAEKDGEITRALYDESSTGSSSVQSSVGEEMLTNNTAINSYVADSVSSLNNDHTYLNRKLYLFRKKQSLGKTSCISDADFNLKLGLIDESEVLNADRLTETTEESIEGLVLPESELLSSLPDSPAMTSFAGSNNIYESDNSVKIYNTRTRRSKSNIEDKHTLGNKMDKEDATNNQNNKSSRLYAYNSSNPLSLVLQNVLENIFRYECYPSSSIMSRLAKLMDVSWKDVKNWFVARRMLNKKSGIISRNQAWSSCSYCPIYDSGFLNERAMTHLLSRRHIERLMLVLEKECCHAKKIQQYKMIPSDDNQVDPHKYKMVTTQYRRLPKQKLAGYAKLSETNIKLRETVRVSKKQLKQAKASYRQTYVAATTYTEIEEKEKPVIHRDHFVNEDLISSKTTSDIPVSELIQDHLKQKPLLNLKSRALFVGYRCPICSLVFQNEWMLIKHSLSHSKFICDECEEIFETENMLLCHLKEHLIESMRKEHFPLFSCLQCRSPDCTCRRVKTFDHSHSTRTFLRPQRAKRSKPFKSKPLTSINDHLRVTLGELMDEIYSVTSGDKMGNLDERPSSQDSGNMKEPVACTPPKTYTNIITFNCTMCESYFFQEDELKEHLVFHRIQSNKRGNKLVRDMSSSASKGSSDEVSSMQKPVAEVLKSPRNLTCNHCESFFSTEDDLKEHLKSHQTKSKRVRKSQEVKISPKESLFCAYCHISYIREHDLRRHLRFQCPSAPRKLSEELYTTNIFELAKAGKGTHFYSGFLRNEVFPTVTHHVATVTCENCKNEVNECSVNIHEHFCKNRKSAKADIRKRGHSTKDEVTCGSKTSESSEISKHSGAAANDVDDLIFVKHSDNLLVCIRCYATYASVKSINSHFKTCRSSVQGRKCFKSAQRQEDEYFTIKRDMVDEYFNRERLKLLLAFKPYGTSGRMYCKFCPKTPLKCQVFGHLFNYCIGIPSEMKMMLNREAKFVQSVLTGDSDSVLSDKEIKTIRAKSKELSQNTLSDCHSSPKQFMESDIVAQHLPKARDAKMEITEAQKLEAGTMLEQDSNLDNIAETMIITDNILGEYDCASSHIHTRSFVSSEPPSEKENSVLAESSHDFIADRSLRDDEGASVDLSSDNLVSNISRRGNGKIFGDQRSGKFFPHQPPEGNEDADNSARNTYPYNFTFDRKPINNTLLKNNLIHNTGEESRHAEHYGKTTHSRNSVSVIEDKTLNSDERMVSCEALSSLSGLASVEGIANPYSTIQLEGNVSSSFTSKEFILEDCELEGEDEILTEMGTLEKFVETVQLNDSNFDSTL